MAEKPTVTIHQGNRVKLSCGNEAREDVVVPPVGTGFQGCSVREIARRLG